MFCLYSNKTIESPLDNSGKIFHTKQMIHYFIDMKGATYTPCDCMGAKGYDPVINRKFVSEGSPKTERPLKGDFFIPSHYVGEVRLFRLPDHLPCRGTGKLLICIWSPDVFIRNVAIKEDGNLHD